MRFVPYKRSIRGRAMGSAIDTGIVAEADIFPLPRGRLAAKLIVFKNPAALNRFWRDALGKGSLGRRCWGAVNGLGVEVETVGGKRDGHKELRGDPRYFCLIGLCANHLTMEVIAHESVHAGFCYEKRVRRNIFGRACDFDEERIAYPAGAIAAAINRFLHGKGLYPENRQC